MLDGPASLLFSCQMWTCGEGESWLWLHPLRMTRQYHPASMAAWLSSTGVSYHSLIPHVLLAHLSALNCNPHPGIVPQSLHSSFHSLYLLGGLHPSLGYVWLWQGLPDSHCIFGCHGLAASLSALKCFSSDTDNCPNVGIRSLLQFPHPSRAGPILITFQFFPIVPMSY